MGSMDDREASEDCTSTNEDPGRVLDKQLNKTQQDSVINKVVNDQLEDTTPLVNKFCFGFLSIFPPLIFALLVYLLLVIEIYFLFYIYWMHSFSGHTISL